MREFVKVASVLVIAAAILTMAFAWVDDRPNQLSRILRFTPILVALAALGVFLRLHLQRDLAPDYLRGVHTTYFDRGGFCFATLLEKVDGVCMLNTYFQNRYERPCVGRVALRPAKEFFGRPDLDTIAIEVRCDGGAFGVHRMAVAIPTAIQGRSINMEVGASAQYPNGQGKMLRFRDGITLRADTDFHNAFVRSVTIAGAMGGMIVLSRSAKAILRIPSDVSELVPTDGAAETTILWRPGDAPLKT